MIYEKGERTMEYNTEGYEVGIILYLKTMPEEKM